MSVLSRTAVASNTCDAKRLRRLVGYISEEDVVRLKEKSAFPHLNPILSILDSQPTLDEGLLRLTKSFSGYYGCSWGEAMETWLPAALRKNVAVDLQARAARGRPAPARTSQ